MAAKSTRQTESIGPFGKGMFGPMMKTPREYWLAGLGTLSFARQEGSRIFDRLVTEGEAFQKRSRKLVETEVSEARERFADLTAGIKVPQALRRVLGLADTVVFHLVPEGEGWAVRLEGEDEDISRRSTKAEALDDARTLAHEREPSRIVVHRADGTIQTSYSYGEAH